jgi:hypothetical protein
MSDRPLNDIFGWLFGLGRPESVAIDQPDPSWLPPRPRIVGETIGDYLNEQGLRVMHIHGTDDFGREGFDTTVVYEPRQDNKHTIRVSTAVCGPLDTFSKKKGVQLALSRWERGERVILPPLATLASHKYDTDADLLRFYFQ